MDIQGALLLVSWKVSLCLSCRDASIYEGYHGAGHLARACDATTGHPNMIVTNAAGGVHPFEPGDVVMLNTVNPI
jgi:hypothetical protein